MKNKDYNFKTLLIGGLGKMEKILTFIGLIGVTMVIAGTLTACNASKETTIQKAANQVEITTEATSQAENQVIQSEEDLRKEIESLAKKAADNSVNNTEDKIKKAEKQFISEAQNYWETKQDELSVCIENGLEYSEFEKNYLLYRCGIDELGIVDADYAFELTLIEMTRLYGTIENAYDALSTENVTINSDGSIKCTDEFMGAMLSYSFFEGATDEEIDNFLKDFIPSVDGMSGEDIHYLFKTFEDTNLHAMNEELKQVLQTPTQSVEAPTQSVEAPTQSAEAPTQSAEAPSEVGDGTFTFSDTPFVGSGVLVDGGYEWNIH